MDHSSFNKIWNFKIWSCIWPYHSSVSPVWPSLWLLNMSLHLNLYSAVSPVWPSCWLQVSVSTYWTARTLITHPCTGPHASAIERLCTASLVSLLLIEMLGLYPQRMRPLDLTKTQSCKVWIWSCLITLKFVRCLSRIAAEAPIKFQRDMIILRSSLAALRLHKIWSQEISIIPKEKPWIPCNFSYPIRFKCKRLDSNVLISCYYEHFSHNFGWNYLCKWGTLLWWFVMGLNKTDVTPLLIIYYDLLHYFRTESQCESGEFWWAHPPSWCHQPRWYGHYWGATCG